MKMWFVTIPDTMQLDRERLHLLRHAQRSPFPDIPSHLTRSCSSSYREYKFLCPLVVLCSAISTTFPPPFLDILSSVWFAFLTPFTFPFSFFFKTEAQVIAMPFLLLRHKEKMV